MKSECQTLKRLLKKGKNNDREKKKKQGPSAGSASGKRFVKRDIELELE